MKTSKQGLHSACDWINQSNDDTENTFSTHTYWKSTYFEASSPELEKYLLKPLAPLYPTFELNYDIKPSETQAL